MHTATFGYPRRVTTGDAARWRGAEGGNRGEMTCACLCGLRASGGLSSAVDSRSDSGADKWAGVFPLSLALCL